MTADAPAVTARRGAPALGADQMADSPSASPLSSPPAPASPPRAEMPRTEATDPDTDEERAAQESKPLIFRMMRGGKKRFPARQANIRIMRPDPEALPDPSSGRIPETLYVEFKVQALKSAVYTRIDRECNSWERIRENNWMPTADPSKFDTVRFQSEIIYAATIPEDKAAIWDNPALWNREAGVLGALDAIQDLLDAGEAAYATQVIETISGFKHGVTPDGLKA